MATQTKCMDDPQTILKQKMCLNQMSKDLKGSLKFQKADQQSCDKPQCRTLKTIHTLIVETNSNKPCETNLSAPFKGKLEMKLLATAFEQQTQFHRGFHAGDFDWVGSGFLVRGRMSGMTNVGTHRKPAFDDCQKCNEQGVMEGRLCGRIVESGISELVGCEVFGSYRIRFDPAKLQGSSPVVGTLEAVIICPCK